MNAAKTVLVVLTMMVAGLISIRAQAAESLSVLLEKGIYAEETLGDVDGAIKIYQQVVDEGNANRRYAAQAQYRLGLALLKKKQPKEAMAAFERVTTEFADQEQVAADAAKRLAEARTSQGMPALSPAIVKTNPAPLANDVDPSLAQITVTFDRKMVDRSWSWTGGGETYPEITGQIHYDAPRTTCMLPVKLEPGKVYWVGINSPSHRNFRSVGGQSAPWFIILFATRSADGKPTEIPEELATRAKKINEDASKPTPVVVKTIPAALANNVSVNLAKITVTFDQPMLDKSWSWTGGGETYPKITGPISYDAQRTTCTLPVKLEPGKVYWVGINSPSHQNFQTPAHKPAGRYVILFATAGADGKPTPIPEEMLNQAKAINAASGSPAAAR